MPRGHAIEPRRELVGFALRSLRAGRVSLQQGFIFTAEANLRNAEQAIADLRGTDVEAIRLEIAAARQELPPAAEMDAMFARLMAGEE